MSADVLCFEIDVRPLGVNNLYANGRPGRTAKGKLYTPRVAKSSTKAYKHLVLTEAMRAAREQGWELDYNGTARITIIDYRKGARGLDWDGIPKAIQDALQRRKRNPVSAPLGDDREIWDGRVMIANGDPPRVVVIVAKTTRDAIAQEARAIEAAARGVNPERERAIVANIIEGFPSFAEAQAEARRRTAAKPRTLDEMKSGDTLTFADRDALLREIGTTARAPRKR